VTNIPYTYGQGWPMLLYLSSLSFLDSTQRHAMGIQDELGISDFFRAHEMSHQWWGHRVGWKSYHDQWMSEGFAQFSGNLYVQFRENPGKYLERIRIDKQQLLSKNRDGHLNESLGPVWMGNRLDSSNGPNGYDVVIYDKGGLVLHTLRMMMRDGQNADPDHFFKDMMKDFCQSYDNKAASTEDFKAIVEKHMVTSMDADQNHRMDWFFNQYVYGTGIPEYRLNYTVEQVADKWVVSGEAVQSGVPDGWKDEVRLYVQMPGKTPVPVGWLRIPGKTSPFKFQLAAKPERLSLNEYEDTLAVIK
jgi:aminopeptidase N